MARTVDWLLDQVDWSKMRMLPSGLLRDTQDQCPIMHVSVKLGRPAQKLGVTVGDRFLIMDASDNMGVIRLRRPNRKRWQRARDIRAKMLRRIRAARRN